METTHQVGFVDEVEMVNRINDKKTIPTALLPTKILLFPHLQRLTKSPLCSKLTSRPDLTHLGLHIATSRRVRVCIIFDHVDFFTAILPGPPGDSPP